MELTKKGEELVKDKAYRYLSPAYVVNFENETRVVKEIHSVGLVNHPNLLKKSLNSKEDLEALKKENEELKKEKEELREQVEILKKEKEELIKEYEKKLTSTKVKNALSANAMLPKREEEALRLSGEALESFLNVCEVEAREVFKDSDLKGLQKNSIDTSVEQKIAQSLGLENLD